MKAEKTKRKPKPVDLDKGQTEDKMIRFRVPLLQAVDRLADSWNWTRSRVVEEACRRLVEREREKGRV